MTDAPREVLTEEFLKDEIRKAGGYAFKWTPTIAGVPDRMIFLPNGVARPVEMKRLNEKPRPLQLEWHARLAAIGHPVAVLDSRDGVRSWLSAQL